MLGRRGGQVTAYGTHHRVPGPHEPPRNFACLPDLDLTLLVLRTIMSKICTSDSRRASECFRPAKSASLHYGVQALVVALDVDNHIHAFKKC